MKLKILSIDFQIKGKGIENYSFYEAPAFSDYDAVIIDPQEISDLWVDEIRPENDGRLWTSTKYDQGFGNHITFFMNSRKHELRHLLTITKGIVVCILRSCGPILNISEYPSESSRRERAWSINRYSWLSNIINSSPISRQGTTIKTINKHHMFNQYLNAFKDFLFFEAVLLLYPRGLPIATNRVGELIAVEYSVKGGKVIFIPPLKNYDPEKVGGVLIDCLKGMLKWNIPSWKPDWVSDYSLPGEDEIITKIKKCDDEISKIEEEKEKLKSEYNKFEMLKGLLYEQGKYGLEPAVREAFRILGFKILEPDEYDEEYNLFSKEEDLTVIGEIEGSENQINLAKYRQLLDYVDREETLNANKVKGILIGNEFVKKKIKERGEQFTEAV